MRWTLEQLVAATGGRATAGTPPPGDGFGPLTIDSRAAVAGSVFVPIVAERDGHAFIGAAVEAGAAAYLYDRDFPGAPVDGAVGIEVTGTAAALADLGRAARRRLEPAAVVGITGSVGKTSTKDLTAAALRGARRVAASERSFNNELGVPLTLANAPADTEVAVVEMGARGIGHIAMLCAVAAPTVAVVTAVAAVHTEVFGTIDDVARGKGELVEALPPGGIAVLNGDDHRVAAMAGRTDAAVLRYGLAAGLDVVAEGVDLDADLRPRFTLRSPWGAAPVRLAVRGAHQVGNALAALTVALHLGVALDAAVEGVGTGELSPWRMELGTAASGARVLNDAYNANPTSMAAALCSLAALPGVRRRVAVLGEMAELGPEGPDAHLEVAALAASLDVEVVAVGTEAYGVAPVADVDAAAAHLDGLRLGGGDAVLVKASRVAGLERLAARLLAGGAPS
ncbi:MAG TPA: UDP-N-acetylmuramoyl-tripeptide--D-alanyl-D-alanine ligase [Acidimicrobiales bacterium]|nr:UDP-N-acetylmuramoyl-tripeptide--D-alanyl-D-alanine ligase [Acidimicrobiales bacterium]